LASLFKVAFKDYENTVFNLEIAHFYNWPPRVYNEQFCMMFYSSYEKAHFIGSYDREEVNEVKRGFDQSENKSTPITDINAIKMPITCKGDVKYCR